MSDNATVINHIKRKHTIAFLTNGAKPPRGGEYLLFYLMVHLRKDIFHPVLIYAAEGQIVRMAKGAGIDTICIPLNSKILTLFPTDVLYNPIKLITAMFYFFRSAYIFKIMSVLKKDNIDLIYSADTFSKIVGGIAGKRLGLKVIAHCHADYSGQLFKNIVEKFLKMVDLFFVDAIIAVSERVKTCFKSHKASLRVTTIYNGIDTNIYDPERVYSSIKEEFGINKDCLIIGNIASMDKLKGQIYLLKAMERLKIEGFDNILCIMCGTGEEETNLKKFVYKSGLVNNVLFFGFRNDIPRVLKIIDIMAITSFAESLSISAIEAMAMKVPVIATNVGGLPEVIDDGKTGILIPPGNVDALCEAIKYLIKNPEIRFQMGQNGRARVLGRFTIEENVRKTEDIFLKVLSEP